MSTIVKTIFGSNLYGTAGPNSDKDIKSVFMPSKQSILLGQIPKSANISDGEIDAEAYSLHHFVKLACEVQTIAIDMLYTPQAMVLETSDLWGELVGLRTKFLSKNMKAFIGYARGQASKYSLKGDRLNKIKRFMDQLERVHEDNPLSLLFDDLKGDAVRQGPHCKEIQIGGKWFGETTAIFYVKNTLNKVLARYGARAQDAAAMGGKDWKALSHALRVSLELKELVSTKNLQFPLQDAGLLFNIKQGKLDIGEVQDMIDQSLAEVEQLVAESDLPEKVDYKFWDNWLIEKVGDYVTRN